jgi:hypothetical protein
MRFPFFLAVLLFAAPAAAQTRAPAPPPAAAECIASGFERAVTTKMTDRLLDMGFVGFEKMTIVDGCYRVEARNSGGDIVLLTFDSAGELIGLGLGSGGGSPRFAPPRDGIREAD